jgi:hypothetical protein
MGIGLVVVAGVEQPDPGGELRRDVDDVFAVLEEPLRERASETLDTYSHLGPTTTSARGPRSTESSEILRTICRPTAVPKHITAGQGPESG